MKEQLIRTVYRCDLQVLTALHVGSGDKLKEDFDFFRQGENIYIVNSSKMFAAVEKLGVERITEFGLAVENKEAGSWLQKNGIRLGDIAAYSIAFTGGRAPNEINAQLRDGFGTPLIPGSSLKGALRTAILRKLAKSRPEFEITAFGKNPKYADQRVCGDLLGKDPKENLLRTLTVGDFSFSAEDMGVHQVRVNRLVTINNFKDKFPICIETLKKQAHSNGLISFDEFLADRDSEEKYFNFKDRLTLAWLIDACCAITRHIIKTELDFLSKKTGKMVAGVRGFYEQLFNQMEGLNENETIIQMAWGSGWRGMTGQLWEQNDLTKERRQTLKLAPKHLSFPFPKSRRIASINGTDLPMGWIKLSFTPIDKIRKELKKKQQQQLELQKELQQKEAAEQAHREKKEQLKAKWEAMFPEERDIAAMDAPGVTENQVNILYKRLHEFSPKNKISLARKLKEYWIKHKKWTKKEVGQKKWKKVRERNQELDQILGKSSDCKGN
jgi:CRISPR-associated protein Csm5